MKEIRTHFHLPKLYYPARRIGAVLPSGYKVKAYNCGATNGKHYHDIVVYSFDSKHDGGVYKTCITNSNRTDLSAM